MRDPDQIGDLIPRAAGGLGVSDPMAIAKVFSAWSEVVGPEVAARCQPTGLDKGVLRVATESAAWAGQFKYLAPELKRRLNEHLGRDVIVDVKAWVKTSSKQTSAFPTSSQPVSEPGPAAPAAPSAAELSQADQMASQISDEKLAGSLKRALLAAKMRKRKG